jgi:hypothetical protein
LLTLWESANTAPFERVLERYHHADPIGNLRAVLGIWVEETDYSPAFDGAVRDWARSSTEAAAAVRRVDARRIDILRMIFTALGYDDPEATVRARVTYYHQVGYYALDVQEPRHSRRESIPVFAKVLSGLSDEDTSQLLRQLERAAELGRG